MFNRETLSEVLEGCFLEIEAFEEGHPNTLGKSVELHLSGVDGGGLSTYGKSIRISPDDEWECRDGYLFVHGAYERVEWDSYKNRKYRGERFLCIPYESIVSLECSPEIMV